MAKRRLFTFGCSYTSYAWPSWANFLSLEFDYFENWGLAGIGNRAIAERVAECNARHHFTKDDVIIVQWTSHIRNDYYLNTESEGSPRGWKTRGSIFNYINGKVYDRRWVNTFFWEPAYIMHSFNSILLTQGLLNSTGCTWYMTGMGDLRNMGTDIEESEGYGEKCLLRPEDEGKEKLVFERVPEFKFYENEIWTKHEDKWLQPLVNIIKKYPELTFEFLDTKTGWISPGQFALFKDYHPSPNQHVLWLEENLKDKLSLTDESLKEMGTLAMRIHELQQLHKANKNVFEMLVTKRQSFEGDGDRMYWPTKYMGF